MLLKKIKILKESHGLCTYIYYRGNKIFIYIINGKIDLSYVISQVLSSWNFSYWRKVNSNFLSSLELDGYKNLITPIDKKGNVYVDPLLCLFVFYSMDKEFSLVFAKQVDIFSAFFGGSDNIIIGGNSIEVKTMNKVDVFAILTHLKGKTYHYGNWMFIRKDFIEHLAKLKSSKGLVKYQFRKYGLDSFLSVFMLYDADKLAGCLLLKVLLK